MTTTSGVAVVATRLARTDRRALSQAWYSALHLAPPPSANARASRAPSGPALAPPAVRQATGGALAPARGGVAVVPARPSHASRPRADVVERRGVPDELTRRVARVVAASARAPRERASQTVALDGGRVTVLVRTDGVQTRVVALCSEALRGPVERALAHVRFTLAARAETPS